MARLTNRLTALQVQNHSERGWYNDGLGLYLQISATGSKSWVYRYTRNGKQRWHGLGRVSTLNGLKEARKSAERCRTFLRDGHDPIDIKQNRKKERHLAEMAKKTFNECATSYIDKHKHGWKNQKHLTQWQNTLTTYAYPVIGELSVQEINVQNVLAIIDPIWHTKTETANRVRQRIELVIDWATAMGFREGANPAQWRGHIEKLLPRPSKVKPVVHHSALPYQDMPEFFTQLQSIETMASRVLQLIILTATRSSEMRLARWDEINLDELLWCIPAERMKSRFEHRVPLQDTAIELLQLQWNPNNQFVFQSNKLQPVTEAAVRKLLKSQAAGVTVHGFRSTFRDWCADATTFQRELAEKALSHSLQSQTEAAYQRGDLLSKRRDLMDAWSNYCLSDTRQGGTIISLRGEHSNQQKKSKQI
jgi:integrase